MPIAAVAIWALTMSGSYHRIEKILLLISCAFVTYVVAGVMVGPDWGDALNATLIPRFSTDPQYFSVLVANIGTTIAPGDLPGPKQRRREERARRGAFPTSALTP